MFFIGKKSEPQCAMLVEMNQELIGLVAGALAFLQLFPYVISILRGHTKPERATYGIWSLVNIIIVASYIASGAETTIWVGIAYMFSQMLVFGLSFKYGVGGVNALDRICLMLALVGAVIWVATSNPMLALYFCLFVKLIGLIPTLRKVYYRPDTENTASWVMCAIASVLNMFALVSFAPEIALLPVYGLLGDGVMALMVLFPKVRPRHMSYKVSAALYGEKQPS